MRSRVVEMVEKLYDARVTRMMTVVHLDMLQELQLVQLVRCAGFGCDKMKSL
jgi:hypothetical protein